MNKRNISYDVILNFNPNKVDFSICPSDSDDEIAIQIFQEADNQRYLIGDYSICGNNTVKRNPLFDTRVGIKPATATEFMACGLSYLVDEEFNIQDFMYCEEIPVRDSFLKALSVALVNKKDDIILDTGIEEDNSYVYQKSFVSLEDHFDSKNKTKIRK